jgi:FtsH-binding integral membrane protein
LNRFIQDLMRDVQGTVQDSVRGGAHQVLRRTLLTLSGGLIGFAGFGFVAASAYLGLSTVLGAAWAALLVGFGLILLAGVLVLLAAARPPKPVPSQAPKPPQGVSEGDVPALVAFTAAFVLARYLMGPDRD